MNNLPEPRLPPRRRVIVAPRFCDECKIGEVVYTAQPGRLATFRGVQVELPADVRIPTCKNCGTEWVDAETSKTINRSLLRAYEDLLRRSAQR